MDAEFLARLQFATTGAIHFLFVTLTLGLVVFVAVLQTVYTVSGSSSYGRMTKFWGKLYVINYGLGIITGLVMEFQFGLNWSGLSKIVGNVFGGPLALETLIAFFVESTCLGMWIFGWGRIPKWIHLGLIWITAITAYASAYWILVANAFLQHPVGYELRGGVAYLSDPGALLTNPSMTEALFHVTSAAVLAGGVFLAGVSSWHLIRRHDDEVYRRSLRWGLVAAFVGTVAVIHFGFTQEDVVEWTQPMKFATVYSDAAGVTAAQQAMAERFGPGDYTVAEWLSIPFNIMVKGSYFMMFASFICLLLLFRGWLFRLRVPLYVLTLMIPLPFVQVICGWLVREVGRQPWTVYGLLKTQEAATELDAPMVLMSYIGFTSILLLVAVVNVILLARHARKGADDVVLGLSLGSQTQPGRALSPI